ncbi:MAG: enoyl-CoA hydratase/isomerase family protein, partial [Myxococcota bacterium]
MRRLTDEHLRAAVLALVALEQQAPAVPGEVSLRYDEQVAWLELDNPGAHNAMTVRMMRQLAEAVLELSSWDGAIVAIRSKNGGSFCSGGHLAQVRQALVQPEAGRVMTDCMSQVLDALLNLEVVGVAILEGAAIG